MQKLLLSLGLLAGSLATAYAQESRFGLKAGASLTTFVGSDVTSSSSSKFGFHGGLVASLGINNRFSVQPELLYSMKGTRDQATQGGTTVTGYQTLHYVDVPIMLKAKFNQLFVEAGPQVGVLMAANATIEDGSNSMSISNKGAFKDVDFGCAVGLGFQAESGLMVGLRYNGGLVDVPKAKTLRGQTLQPQARNSAVQLYVGILLKSR